MGETDYEKDMRAYYAARASYYDWQYEIGEFKEEWSRIRDFLKQVLVGHRILEVACGTGYWTKEVGEVAESVMATDAVEGPLAIARERLAGMENVSVRKCDAYDLSSLPWGFSAGFHFQWISHVPKSRLREFHSGFQGRLTPGALIVFGDNCMEGDREDDEGNHYHIRELRDGSSHAVIKNWLREEDVKSLLGDEVEDIDYHVFGRCWLASCRLSEV